VVRGATQITPYRWTFAARVLSNQPVDRARWRNTLMYRASPDLQIGVEYNPLSPQGNVGPLLNWRALRETKEGPAVIFGTSSDRIGTPRGQAYYMTVSKSLGQGVSLYAGMSYSSFQNQILYPCGMNIDFGEKWSALFSFDGVNFHPMATYRWDRYTATFILVGSKNPGVTFSVGF